jgi:hypothetical protein
MLELALKIVAGVVAVVLVGVVLVPIAAGVGGLIRRIRSGSDDPHERR